jgi:hypothetical protein
MTFLGGGSVGKVFVGYSGNIQLDDVVRKVVMDGGVTSL